MSAPNARPLAVPASLFILLTGLYVWLAGAHVYSPDGVVMARLTEALVDDGALSFRELPGWPEHGGPPAPALGDGAPRRFSKYGLLPSVAAVPAWVASGWLARWAPADEAALFATPVTIEGRKNAKDASPTFDGDPRPFRTLFYRTAAANFREALGIWCIQLTSAPVVAALAALAYLLAVELGYRRRAALAVCLVIGVCSPFLCYGREFWSEPFAALALVGAVWALVRVQAARARLAALVGAGALLGALVLIKPALFLLAFPVAGLHLASVPSWERRLKHTLLAALGAGAPIALGFAYNAARFGSPYETGYGAEASEWTTPAVEGAFGLLVSPGRGVLVYAPLVLLGYSTLPRLWRRSRFVAGVAATSLPLLVALYCRWWMWEGGWCWGPRFLLPAIPLLAFGAAELAEGGLRRLHVAFGLVVLGVSAIAAWSTVLVHDFDLHVWIWRLWKDQEAALSAQGATSAYDIVHWDWRFAPIVRYWTFPVKETLLWPLAMRQPGAVLGVYGVALFAVAAGALGLRRAWAADSSP